MTSNLHFKLIYQKSVSLVPVRSIFVFRPQLINLYLNKQKFYERASPSHPLSPPLLPSATYVSNVPLFTNRAESGFSLFAFVSKNGNFDNNCYTVRRICLLPMFLSTQSRPELKWRLTGISVYNNWEMETAYTMHSVWCMGGTRTNKTLSVSIGFIGNHSFNWRALFGWCLWLCMCLCVCLC